MNQDNVSESLEQLFQQRPHGAATIAAFRFQLLYSLDRLLDLANDENLVTAIQLEGIDDVDIRCHDTKTFIQVKSSKKKQGWGWLNQEKILDRFAEVYRFDKAAHFKLVTNCQFTGDLRSLYLFAEQSETTLPAKLTRRLAPIMERLSLTQTEIENFLNRISFEIIDQTSLYESIREKLISRFEIHTGNEDLYFRAMYSKVDVLASRRSTCRAEDLHRFVLQIKDWISAGPTSRAVKDGWIERLQFEPDPNRNEEDYYLGKGARPAHILADVDAQRPEWIRAIHESLSVVQVCIVRSSSGQGKSTLLYRYAYDFFDHHTTFVLKKIQDSDEIGPLKMFLESRLRLGVPILVLVNDLNERVKLWHELARELAGQPIKFLIASREENWSRYAGNLHNLHWKTVKPELGIREAKEIYRQFKKRGRIANNVKSAAWAYDKVATQKLLIEFVFLITHGQMLSERLEDQVQTIYSLQEDSAKLHILRLACLAQYFDVRIPLERLYSRVQFQSDPQQAVKSLIGEYLDVTADEYLDGLHYVRSEHLVKILHEGLPVNATTTELIGLVGDDDLPVLVRSAFSGIDAQSDAERLLNGLLERTAGRVVLTLEVLQALFRADEHRYILRNRDTIDLFRRTFGGGALSTFFAHGNMPLSSGLDVVEELRKVRSGEEWGNGLDLMQAVIQKMPSRREEEQFARRYVTKSLRRLVANDLSANLSAVSSLRTWSQMYNVSFEFLNAYIDSDKWRDLVFAKPIEEFADFMHLLNSEFPGAYREFIDEHWLKAVNHFRIKTETLEVKAQGDKLHIEFVVNEARDIHDEQTLSRLRTLMKLLPHYESYTSQGLYPVTPIDRHPIDDSKKCLTHEESSQDVAEINSRYILELETLVNPDSMYDWLEYWHKFRTTLSAYVEALAKFFGDILEKKATVNSRPPTDALAPLLDETAGVPALYKEVFEQQVKELRRWKGLTNNIVNLSRQIDDADRLSESTRLLRHNVAEVCGRLTQMQDAYKIVLDSGVSHFQPTIKNENEEKGYRYLYDLLNYYVSLPANRAVPRGTRVKAMVSAWRKSQWREVSERLKAAFQSAADNGLRVHLPNCYFDELPSNNLCFAVELIDATDIYGHLDVFAKYLQTAAVAYDYVYILPVIKGRPIQSLAYFVHSQTVSDIAAGKQLDDEIAVWPVETPEGLFQSVSSIDRRVLPEWRYYLDAQGILCRLHALRNEVAFISERVEDELSTWRRRLFAEIEQRLLATVDDANHLIESASRFQVQLATEEWNTMWQYVAGCVENKRETVFEVAEFDPVPFGDDEGLMLAYGAYLNHEHLYIGV